MQSPTTMRSTGAGARAASRACDSEPRLAGELPAGELAAGEPCAGDAAARGELSPLELRATRGSGGSAWTAVGAELFEPAGDAGWGCEPPGFIAAESSRAVVPVEAYRAEFEPFDSPPRLECWCASGAGCSRPNNWSEM